MVEMTPLSDEELEKLLEGGRGMRRGRVSYPIFKMFMEGSANAVKLDIQAKNAYYRAQVLRQYAKEHKLPVKIITRSKEIFLVKSEVVPEEELGEPVDLTEANPDADKEIEEKGKMVFDKVT